MTTDTAIKKCFISLPSVVVCVLLSRLCPPLRVFLQHSIYQRTTKFIVMNTTLCSNAVFAKNVFSYFGNNIMLLVCFSHFVLSGALLTHLSTERCAPNFLVIFGKLEITRSRQPKRQKPRKIGQIFATSVMLSLVVMKQFFFSFLYSLIIATHQTMKTMHI